MVNSLTKQIDANPQLLYKKEIRKKIQTLGESISNLVQEINNSNLDEPNKQDYIKRLNNASSKLWKK